MLEINNFIVSFLWIDSLSLKEILIKILIKQQKFQFFTWKKNNLEITPIHFLPLRRFKIIQRINIYLNALLTLFLINSRKKLREKEIILWIFDPKQESLVGKFTENLTIYDCLDYYSSIDPKENQAQKENEKKLFDKTDIVFVNSRALFNLKKSRHKRIYLVSQGFDIKTYSNRKSFIVPNDIKKIKKPIIGFIGSVDYRIDFDLLYKLAFKNPEWSFVFIGSEGADERQETIINFPKKIEKLKKMGNIHFLGKRDRRYLPNYISRFDIAIIPYNTNLEFCLYCYPMKIFEYFYLGKPVISTPIEEFKRFPKFVKIGKNYQEWEKYIKKLLAKPWPKKYMKEQRSLAKRNSWEEKINLISRKIQEFSDIK